MTPVARAELIQMYLGTKIPRAPNAARSAFKDVDDLTVFNYLCTYPRFELLVAHGFEELSMAPIYEAQTGALPGTVNGLSEAFTRISEVRGAASGVKEVRPKTDRSERTDADRPFTCLSYESFLCRAAVIALIPR